MAQILDPIPNEQRTSFLCCYVNKTSQIQIARITNIPNWYFERVVFPGQRLIFEALPEALLEIHTGMMASAILSDTIPCERLGIDESSNSATEFTASSAERANPDNRQNITAVDNKAVEDVASLEPVLVSAN